MSILKREVLYDTMFKKTRIKCTHKSTYIFCVWRFLRAVQLYNPKLVHYVMCMCILCLLVKSWYRFSLIMQRIPTSGPMRDQVFRKLQFLILYSLRGNSFPQPAPLRFAPFFLPTLLINGGGGGVDTQPETW